jgi:hypothetical protein
MAALAPIKLYKQNTVNYLMVTSRLASVSDDDVLSEMSWTQYTASVDVICCSLCLTHFLSPEERQNFSRERRKDGTQ